MRACALGSYWCRHTEVVSQTVSKAEVRSFLLCYKRVMVMDIRAQLMLIFGVDANTDFGEWKNYYKDISTQYSYIHINFFFAMCPWISPFAPSKHTIAIKVVILGRSSSSTVLLAITLHVLQEVVVVAIHPIITEIELLMVLFFVCLLVQWPLRFLKVWKQK